jgi:hypothetical protein
MKLSKKDRLEKALYNWIDANDIVEEDITSLIDGHSISMSRLATHISDSKYKLKRLELLLKEK